MSINQRIRIVVWHTELKSGDVSMCVYPPLSYHRAIIVMNQQLRRKTEADDKLRNFTKNADTRFEEQAKTNDLLVVEVGRLTAKIKSLEVELAESRNEVLRHRDRLVELGDPAAVIEAELAASEVKDAELFDKVRYRRRSTRCLLRLRSPPAACRTTSSTSQCFRTVSCMLRSCEEGEMGQGCEGLQGCQYSQKI